MTYARPAHLPPSERTYTGPRRESLNLRYQPCDTPSVPIESPQSKQGLDYSELIEQAEPKPRAFSGIANLQPPNVGARKSREARDTMGDKIMRMIADGPLSVDELQDRMTQQYKRSAVEQQLCRMAKQGRLQKVGRWVCTNETDPEPLKTRPALPAPDSIAGRVLAVIGSEPALVGRIVLESGLTLRQVRIGLLELQRRNCVRQIRGELVRPVGL